MPQIPEPFQFNPLKHHLGCIREFISEGVAEELSIDSHGLLKELKRIGTSVMDVYSGRLNLEEITAEIISFIKEKNLENEVSFGKWAGKNVRQFRIIQLSDTSQWTLKYHNDKKRFVHLFPARSGPHSFRVKANTLKSAILYVIFKGKDYITADDLNQSRALLGLSPVKDTYEIEAITEMIEVLRV